MADILLRFDANNGERGAALRRVLASEGAQADLSDLLAVQRYETFAPSAAGSGDGDLITVTAPQPGTLEYALYTSQNAFQSVGGLSADDAYAAVGVLADNISNARGASGASPAFLSREVDSFMMGAGDTATWVAQEINERPLLRWSLEAVSIASGPAHYAIGKVLEPVTESAMGRLTAAAQDRFSTTGHTDVDSGRGATGVLAVGSLVAGTVAGAGAVRALEIFGRFRIVSEGAGMFGGNVRFRPTAGATLRNMLRGFETRTFQAGSNTFRLDRSGMTHILERHHPDYWNGSRRATQTFFDRSMTPDDVANLAMEGMRQNRDAFASMRVTTNPVQLPFTYQGQRYMIGVSGGRVGQLYPLPGN
jgi:hypothetical protein